MADLAALGQSREPDRRRERIYGVGNDRSRRERDRLSAHALRHAAARLDLRFRASGAAPDAAHPLDPESALPVALLASSLPRRALAERILAREQGRKSAEQQEREKKRRQKQRMLDDKHAQSAKKEMRRRVDYE